MSEPSMQLGASLTPSWPLIQWLSCLPPLSPSSHFPHQATFQIPAAPARCQPHLMLIKLPEDTCTCSARISSSFTPTARLRGLEVGSRQKKESGEPLGHFLETSHLQGYRAAHCPVYFTSGFLLSALYQAGQPNPQGIGRLPQAAALTSGQ